MKLKTLLAGLLATFLLQHTVLSQTNEAAADQPAVAADTNVTTSRPSTTTPPKPPTHRTPPPRAVAVADAATNAPADVAGPVSTSIPLIQFQDVPLTTAIENLARQANINYLLDPKINYGQPEANGQIKAEPNLSIRWENITAEHALDRLVGQLRAATGRGCKDQDLPDHHQGSRRLAAAHHPGDSAQICQHHEHDGFCAGHVHRQTQPGVS